MLAHISIVGRITATPKLKTVTNKAGQEVVCLPLTIAVNDKVVSEEGVFYDATIWGTYATTLAPYLNKGDTVAVTGHLLPEINISNNKVYQNLVIKRADITLFPNKNQKQRETPEPATKSAPKKAAPASDEQIPW